MICDPIHQLSQENDRVLVASAHVIMRSLIHGRLEAFDADDSARAAAVRAISGIEYCESVPISKLEPQQKHKYIVALDNLVAQRLRSLIVSPDPTVIRRLQEILPPT